MYYAYIEDKKIVLVQEKNNTLIPLFETPLLDEAKKRIQRLTAKFNVVFEDRTKEVVNL